MYIFTKLLYLLAGDIEILKHYIAYESFQCMLCSIFCNFYCIDLKQLYVSEHFPIWTHFEPIYKPHGFHCPNCTK
jgi:hypothetical protein